MRSALLALLVWAPVAVQAATPEQDYIAARDKYIAKFTQAEEGGKFDDAAVDDHKRALDDLEVQLRRLVGPVAIKGFSPDGKTNLDGLIKGDEGFGRLDALVFSPSDQPPDSQDERTTKIIVTTNSLLDRWLREHKAWWGPSSKNVPQNVTAALKTEAFYTQAISTDAAVSRYAEIPVTKPATAKLAYAMLATRAQDDGPRTPDELIVSMAGPARLFIVSAPVAAKIEPIAACEEIWNDYVRRSEEALEAHQQSQNQDAPSGFDRLREEGDAAFHRCYAQRVKAQPFFAALVKEVQALVALVPAR